MAKVASLNPDSFVQGGLADDFDGTIEKARFVPWDYNGNIDHHVLAVAITIKPDDEDAFVQHYSAGDLEQFVPSQDGETSVDLENGEGEALEGEYALQVGKKEALASSSNFAQFIGAAVEAGFPVADITAACSFLEGHKGHFNRIPQKKRSGLVQSEEQQKKGRASEILVMTEYKGKASGGAKASGVKSKPGSKPAAKPESKASAPAGGGDLDSQIADVIVAEIKKADGTLPKSKVAQAVLKAFTGADKAKAVKRAAEVEFLNSQEERWVFDADSATLIGTE